MKIVRYPRNQHDAANTNGIQPPPWKVLVVDDEADIRALTTLNLRGFEFSGRPLQLLEADSAKTALEMLNSTPDIALALVDVVMESDDAGLKLVETIRNDLNNRLIRLVIRTGQPGLAPERYVIDHFDIDDYKDKTELTAQKLYTTVRSALKSYRDLQAIEMNRIGLSKILDITPDLYDLHYSRLEEYFFGVLTQVVGLCNLGGSNLITSVDGLVATLDGSAVQVWAGTGEFSSEQTGKGRREEISRLCSLAVKDHIPPQGLRPGAVVAPLEVSGETLGFFYLEPTAPLSLQDLELIQVMANQCAAALNNMRLHHNLEQSYDEAIDMLGNVAEFKDSATGAHILRIEEYTRRVALALGLDTAQAEAMAKASRLHDIGKVGISDNILRKTGKLTDEEYKAVKRHTQIGDAILSRSRSLETARIVAKGHHERWDGNGYPRGLAGADIPLSARVVAVVDVFDALVSRRPYKDPWDPDKAAKEIISCSGSQFDPAVVDIFLKLYSSGQLADLVTAGANCAGCKTDPSG